MKLKLFLIFISLAVYSEAFKSSIIKKLPKNVVLDQSSSNPPNTYSTRLGKNVNLLINVYHNSATVSVPVALDTTTSEFWFVSDQCKSPFCSGKTTGGLPNGTSQVTAHGIAVRGTETSMKLRFDTNQELMDVDVVAADYVSPFYSKNYLEPTAYGVLGLGPNTKLLKSLKPSLLVSLYIDEDRKTPDISMFFNELPPSLKADDFASLTYAKSTSVDEWRFQIGYIGTSYGHDHQWCNYRCSAVLDVNYAGISGPAKDINSLNKYLGADEDGNIDCYKKYQLEPLIFHISGRRILLSPRSFIVKSTDQYSSKCQTVFEPDYKYDGRWTLGFAFMKQRVTVFDYAERQLAFLPLSSN